MLPFVFDANAIHAFQEERLRGVSDVAHQAVNSVFIDNCIALDTEKLCLQEWIDCAGGMFPFALTDWISDQLIVGNIRIYGLSDTSCRKKLLNIGLPPKDHKWVRLAIGCAGRKLVSGDVDFFDPKKKKASSDTKAKMKASRTGNCLKTLKKEYSIDVLCLEHVSQKSILLRTVSFIYLFVN